MEPTISIDKYKYDIRNRGNHMDKYRKKNAVSRDRTTQKFDPYELYDVLNDDDFKFHGMGYDDNDLSMISEIL